MKAIAVIVLVRIGNGWRRIIVEDPIRGPASSG
jgi:hypothetical protein